MRMDSPLIKICGLTRLDDALAAVDLGVAMLGFVFWRQSPRWVEPVRVREIVKRLPRSTKAIGVFVNEASAVIDRIAETAGIHVVQLHGDEPELSWGRAGRPVIKAVGVRPDFDWRIIASWPAGVTPLLDADDPVRRGGTGRRVDWALAVEAARARPIILSGGLRPENVREAIAVVRPWAVDVSSGVESAPGQKDVTLMRAFVAAVRGDAKGLVE